MSRGSQKNEGGKRSVEKSVRNVERVGARIPKKKENPQKKKDPKGGGEASGYYVGGAGRRIPPRTVDRTGEGRRG